MDFNKLKREDAQPIVVQFIVDKVNDMINGTGAVASTTRPDDSLRLDHAGDESHLLREIMRTHQALVTVFTREVGMPASRLVLLRVLAGHHPNAIGVLDLARKLGINAAAVTRQVKDLERAGMVKRLQDAQDGRRSPLLLTTRGLRRFREIHDRSHDFERSLGGALSDVEVATAVRVLAEVRAALEAIR